MIKLTEKAAEVIQQRMDKNGLDRTKFAFHLYLHEGNLSLTFSDTLNDAKKVGDIYFKVDHDIERCHEEESLIIDYATNGTKSGIIFLGEKQYERFSNGKSSN